MSTAPALTFPGAVQLKRVVREQLDPHFVECEIWAYVDGVPPFHCCRAFIKEDGTPFLQARHAVMSLAEAETLEFALQVARDWVRDQLGIRKTMKLFSYLPDEQL
jgi:hypothetical protein